ncbi:MAG: amino acid permease [Gammaproteobacteria bacterium CG11_big_fil_rev_8_21_14_0_20_46_22]|nr:MAG: amino acid permease [Gammaproteobacteria bacterium CG12_big_fil_rev_8_21_14_0_65_46_12]PIR12147.1 MAG: amino acid permease [Gammaproteobacteria bacterium CG11_big_fil_rev_8_21_14_0_20_46_22]
MSQPKNHRLSVFSLVMINVIAIDSLRNLPINAEYGYAIIFFYILGAIGFLIPSALVTAELATHWSETGGPYVWVREAFGKKAGFFAIWLDWIYNVVWFPTILSFIGATAASLFRPDLVNNAYYMVAVIIICFLLATAFNLKGMKVSSRISELGAILGTMLPMAVLVILGFAWLHGHTSRAETTHFLPSLSDAHNMAFLVAVVFSLLGIEMSSIHAGEVKNPAKDYPRALIISCVLIVLSLILASVAIAIVVPPAHLSLVNGLNQAFALFFAHYHLSFLTPVFEVLIMLGGFAGMAAWVIGPTKALMISAQDGSLPKQLAKKNPHGAPKNILFLQAIIVIILSITFILSKSVNSAYWLLSALTAQLAMIYYACIFLAALKLRKSQPERKPEAYRIPGGKWGLSFVCGLGLLTITVALVIGFIPPENIPFGTNASYVITLLIGMAIFTLPAFVIYRFRQRAD